MDGKRMLTGLLEAGSHGRSEYSVRPYASSTRTFAAFAYVAEQLGYRYMGHTPGTGATNNPYYSFQRTPDASERAAATVADHPDMLHGGALPGMHPGGGLRPNGRVLGNLILLLVAAAVLLGFMGYTLDRVLIAGGIWCALFALYLIGLAVTRRKRTKHVARLTRAGVEWPPPRIG